MTAPAITYCDFCGSDAPRWRYSVNDYVALVTKDIVVTNVGDWAACDACHTLIEACDRGKLARRHPYSVSIPGRRYVEAVHDGFFVHKQVKPAYRIEN